MAEVSKTRKKITESEVLTYGPKVLRKKSDADNSCKNIFIMLTNIHTISL